MILAIPASHLHSCFISTKLVRRSPGAILCSARMDTPAYAKAREALAEASPCPEVVVFDLDYCLWPFWCEMYTPEDTPRLYPEAEAVLDAVRGHGLKVALASRTPTPHVAQAFLKKLELDSGRIDNMQLIPASSGFDHHSAQKDVAHFPNIRSEMGIEYNRMLFFDDEAKNVKKVSKLGVCSILVDTSTGVNVETFKEGLTAYSVMHSQ